MSVATLTVGPPDNITTSECVLASMCHEQGQPKWPEVALVLAISGAPGDFCVIPEHVHSVRSNYAQSGLLLSAGPWWLLRDLQSVY